MPLAAKHFDLVVGVDVHIVMLPSPAGLVPTPMPVPFTGFVFDPMEWLPGQATVWINGMPRATAGTSVLAAPGHVPVGGPFLKPPGNEGEVFMGSSTVIGQGEPLAFGGVPVLTCQDIGLPAPKRMGKVRVTMSLLLPTSVLLAIPSGAPVEVGGAPTASLKALVKTAFYNPAVKELTERARTIPVGQSVDGALKRTNRWLEQGAERMIGPRRTEGRRMLWHEMRRFIAKITFQEPPDW